MLRDLHADDFELINPVGGKLSKEQYLRRIASGELDYLDWEPGEIRVRLYGDSAVIRYQGHLRLLVKGSAGRPVTFWHTDLYEKRNGQWQIVWSHATQVQRDEVPYGSAPNNSFNQSAGLRGFHDSFLR